MRFPHTPSIAIKIFPNLLRALLSNSKHLCKRSLHHNNSNLLSRAIPAVNQPILAMDALREYLHRFAGGAVRLEKDPTRGVAIITLDHPEKRNAISGRMMVELHDRIKELEAWEQGKCCILRGAGANYCSGGDLAFARASGTPEGSSIMNQWMVDTLTRLNALKMLTVCVLHGPSLGGGTEIALACDFILVAENVKFGCVHGRLGITTAWGGGTRLTQRIGKQKALDVLLTARILSAKECLELGIADEIIPNNSDASVNVWLENKLQFHHSVIRAMKEITTHATNLSVDQSLKEERRIFLPFWGGQLNKAALDKQVKHVPRADKCADRADPDKTE